MRFNHGWASLVLLGATQALAPLSGRGLLQSRLPAALALMALSVCACAHVTSPTPTRLDTPETSRKLAILPAPSPFAPLADQALAGATLVSVAIESRPVALSVWDIPALIEKQKNSVTGEDAACLLEPDWTSQCLARLYRGAWIEVIPVEKVLELRLHPGGDAPVRALGTLDPTLPVEQLRALLEKQLALPPAPPGGSGDAPVLPEQGVCLTADQLEPLGKRIRGGALGATDAVAISNNTLLVQVLMLDTPPALTLDQKLPELAPTCGRARLLEAWGRGLLKDGRPTAAAAAFGMSARSRPYQDGVLAQWAEALVADARPQDAAQVLRRALLLDPEWLPYRRELADAQVQAGSLSEARGTLIEGFSVHRSALPQSWLELDIGRLDEGEESFQKAALHYKRGLSLLDSEGVDEATFLRGSLLNALGTAQIGLEQYEAAVENLQKAVTLREAGLEPGALSPTLGNSLYNLGVAYARQARWADAIPTLQRAALQYGGEEGLQTLLDLARFLHEGALPTEALDALAELRAGAPTLPPRQDAEWYYLKGLAQGAAGLVDLALETLQEALTRYQALEDSVLEGQVLFNIGIIAGHYGRWETSLEAFAQAREKALQLHDNASVLEIDARVEQVERDAQKARP